MKKVILFDLDGTLIDSTDAILESFYHALDVMDFEHTLKDKDITGVIGYPLDIMFGKLGVPQNVVWDFVDAYKQYYRNISVEKTVLLENAYEAVIAASKFAKLGVVTTKTTQYSIPMMENFGLMKYFDVFIGRQEVENPKPHPEPILKAMEGLCVTPHTHDVFMIGDTKLDLIAAKEANVVGVGVTCGYGTEDELKNYTNCITIDSMGAVEFIKNQ